MTTPGGGLAALETEGIVSFWSADPSGRLVSATGTLGEAVAGIPLMLVETAPIADRVAIRYAAAARVREAIRSGRPFRDVRVLIHGAGAQSRVFSLSGVPTADASGACTGFTGIATDVTASSLAGEIVASIGESVGRRTGQDFLDGLVGALGARLALDLVFVGRVDPLDGSRITAISVWRDGAAGEGFVHDVDRSPCRRVLDAGPVCIEDGAHARLPGDDRPGGETAVEAAGFVGVPLHIGDDRRPLGILVGASRQALADGHPALDCLTRFAERAALELEHRDAVVADRERDRRNLRLLDGIQQLWQTVLERGPSHDQVERITESAASAMRCARVGVWRLDAERQEIACLHVAGADPDAPQAGPGRSPGHIAAVLERRIVAVADMRAEARMSGPHRAHFDAHGISSTLDVRISGGGEDIGILCFEHVGPPRAWTPEEVAFASSVADLAALVFVNRRLDGTTRQLERLTEELTLAQKVARIGHWVVRIGEEAMTLSPEAGRLLGLPSDTPIPRTAVMGCFAEESVRDYLARRDRLLATGAPFEMEARATPGGRPPLWVRISLWPTRAPDGSIEGVFGTIQDIDDRKQAELHLYESQEQLAEAQRIARLGYFRSDLKAGTVQWSDLLVAMTGASTGALSHEEADRMFEPEGWAEFLSRRAASLATGAPFTGRMRVANADRWITYRGVPRFDRSGTPEAIFGVVQDITEQVRLEQERARADAFLRNLVEHASISITVKDVSGRILLANAEVRRQLGLDDVDLVGETLRSMLEKAGMSDRADVIEAEDDAVLDAGRPMEFTYRIRTRNGEERDFNAIKFPIRDEAGTIIALGTLRSDITELKRAQHALEAANERLEAEVEARTAELRASEERFRDIASSASDWFFETDRDRLFAAYSDGFERATGIAAGAMLGLPFDETRPDPAVVGEEGVAGWTRVRELLASGRPIRDVEYWRRDPGGHRYLRMSARPRFTDGAFAGYRGCASDITVLADARRKLAEADRLASLGRLVAGVAHELNTPIGSSLTVATTLQGSVDPLLRRYREDAMTEEAFFDFLDRVRTGARLISNNLAQAGELVRRFKQVSVDQTSHLRRRFDLRDLVDNNVAALLPSVRPSAVTVRNDVPHDLWLDSYPGPLGQIVVNLVQNAFVHAFEGRDGGTIRVTATPLGDDHLRLAIADDGVGMTEEVRKRLFEPFFTTRLGRGGSGLGMNIVYNIVTRVLGGTIRVGAEHGRGTVVELDLPQVAPTPPTERPSGA